MWAEDIQELATSIPDTVSVRYVDDGTVELTHTTGGQVRIETLKRNGTTYLSVPRKSARKTCNDGRTQYRLINYAMETPLVEWVYWSEACDHDLQRRRRPDEIMNRWYLERASVPVST